MENPEIEGKVREIRRRDTRYDAQAFYFIFEALDHAIVTLGKSKYEGKKRHVTGRELLESIRAVAKHKFGWLARTVFNSWGVTSTEDFGHIVFLMVSEKLLHKQDTDTIEDFRGAYDFAEAFETDFDFEIPWDNITPRNS